METTREQLATLLRLYAESGLDFAIEAEPVDRFAEAAEPPAPARAAAPARKPEPAPARPVQPAAVPPDDEAVRLAIDAAQAAHDLDALVAAARAFEGCNLKRSARHTIVEGGNRQAPVMLVGAAPSRDDDQNGAAMSGLDGLMLDMMLGAIGLDRQSDVYCGFCVPWAVPGGERPTALQLKICAPFIHRQIALAGPAVVVALGNVAARHLTGSDRTIMQLRGTWRRVAFGETETDVTALFEPGFLRDQPRFKRQAWLDLLALKDRLAEGGRRH
ncbi:MULTISPECIES: uracil-DNA glycosylase [unclassified Roseitalea]|uniref:uracil-DNA glycosylase n=1 Tax=unclassified Roseitalea TaxID=2639107 RepID=UPI00273F53A5|nr:MULTISPECIES: uracil-DNA glycosylase [unclassified Roseitalea]